MQRRNALTLALAGALAATGLATPTWAQPAAPKIAVTSLAYTQRVSEYFAAGSYQRSAQMSAQGSQSGGYSGGPYGGSGGYSGQQSMQASEQSSGSYVAGSYSYIQYSELSGFTNDLKGALLQGTYFKLLQGKGFDTGAPQPSKGEQVLNQLQGGKMAKVVIQPNVNDIIARIRKGEFNGADYVLFGTVSSVEFRDSVSPIQGTSSTSHQYTLDLLADFSLIDTRTYQIKASFSAQGAGNDTKLVSSRGDILPPNRAKVMRDTSLSLAGSAYQQLVGQLGYSDPNMARGVRPQGQPYQGQPGQPYPMQPQAAPPEEVMIIR